MRADSSRQGLLALVLLLVSGAAQAYVFCCDDASGQQVCGDVLPPQCYGRAYRVMNSQGVVIRDVEAPLTREQLKERREEERRKRAEADRIRAQKLRERALLETYRDVEDIDRQEERAVAEVEGDIIKARQREEELLKDRARLGREKEFYEGKNLPGELRKQLTDNEQEILTSRTVIAAKQKTIEAIRQRYSEDRTEYQAIIDRREALLRR